MKYILIGLTALSASLFATFSSAQQAQRIMKPVVCEQSDIIMDNVKKSPYKETPYWVGTSASEQSAFLIILNKDTGTWTLLQVSNQGITCILGMGEQFQEQKPTQ